MRSIATAHWNTAMPDCIARTLPRGIRRAIAGVRRPLHPLRAARPVTSREGAES